MAKEIITGGMDVNKSNAQPSIPLVIAAKIENRNDYSSDLWVTLPIAKDFFLEVVGAICDSWDDLRIGLYYTTIPNLFVSQLMETPFSLVNHLAARLKTLNGEQILKLLMLQERNCDYDAIEQMIDYTYQPEKYELLRDVSSYRQLGNLRKSELDANSLPPYLIRCIDTFPFGIEAALHENGSFTPLGYLSYTDRRKKNEKKHYIPVHWDIKGKDGKEIFGDWSCNQLHEPLGVDCYEEMEVGDDI
jgi:hypothetical protein